MIGRCLSACPAIGQRGRGDGGGGEIGHALGAPPPPSGRHDGFRPSAGKGPWWSGWNPRQIQRTGRLWPFASSLLLKMSHFDNKAIKHRSDWLPNVHMGWVGIADSALLPLFPVNNSCTSVRFHRSYHVGTSHFTAIWVNCERKPPPPWLCVTASPQYNLWLSCGIMHFCV